MLDTVVQKTFAAILARLADSVGPSAFARWFSGVEVAGFRHGTMTIAAPNVFIRDWIRETFTDEIVRAAESVLGSRIAIEVVVNLEAFAAERASSGQARPARRSGGAEAASDRTRFHERFVRLPENSYALSAAEHFVDRKEPRINPLLLVGGPGTGKSEILKAIGRRLAEKGPIGEILEINANTFTQRFTMALKTRSVAAFRSIFESASVVIFDEIHRLKGREATQNEFLTVLARLEARGVPMVLASRHKPQDIHHLAAPLASLLARGIVAKIEPYSADSLVRIHRATAVDLSRAIEDSVLREVALTAAGDVRLFRERMAKLAEYATFLGEMPTPEFARRHLSTVILESDQGKDVEAWLIERVASYFDVTREMLVSKKKIRRLTLPRAMVACLFRDVLKKTFVHTGVVLGGRTHAAIHLIYKAHAESFRTGEHAAFFRELARSAGRALPAGE